MHIKLLSLHRRHDSLFCQTQLTATVEEVLWPHLGVSERAQVQQIASLAHFLLVLAVDGWLSPTQAKVTVVNDAKRCLEDDMHDCYNHDVNATRAEKELCDVPNKLDDS